MTLLHWILSASGLILVVLALRALLGRRISAAMRYALWGVGGEHLPAPHPVHPG